MNNAKAQSPELPARLYKYMPLKHVDAFLAKGAVLFRNLAHFRKCEEKGRSDLLEGLHMDHPDNPVMLRSVNNPGQTLWAGDAAFLNSIDPNKVFVFCLSHDLSDALFEEFRSDACVEIIDPKQFIARVTRQVRGLLSFRQHGLLHGPVHYYAPNKPTKASVENPLTIPFFKHEAYSHQHEYRLVLPLRNGLKLKQSVIHWKLHSFDDEVATGMSKEKTISMGTLADICKVHLSERK
jgi:hypothetical protein